MNNKVHRKWIVNGQEFLAEFDTKARLLDVLLNLGFTSLKEGCGEGECGACSVLINDELRLACLELAALLPDGTKILTSEGIAETSTGHAIKEAFLRCGAVQCGFCTPGMVVAAYWYLTVKPNIPPTEALSGNFCRCTGYKKLTEALEFAQELLVQGQAHCKYDTETAME